MLGAGGWLDWGQNSNVRGLIETAFTPLTEAYPQIGKEILGIADLALKNDDCAELVGGNNKGDVRSLLKDLNRLSRIKVGDIKKINSTDALGYTFTDEGHGRSSFILLDSEITMKSFIGSTSSLGILKPGGARNNWDLNIIRAVVLLHELSHSSGAYYHPWTRKPYSWSRLAPYKDPYRHSSLDVLIFNVCFKGWLWSDRKMITPLEF